MIVFFFFFFICGAFVDDFISCLDFDGTHSLHIGRGDFSAIFYSWVKYSFKQNIIPYIYHLTLRYDPDMFLKGFTHVAYDYAVVQH